jgi:hypothetical protein
MLDQLGYQVTRAASAAAALDALANGPPVDVVFFDPAGPMTLGGLYPRSLDITSKACGHHATVNVDAWPDEEQCPFFGPRMRCTKSSHQRQLNTGLDPGARRAREPRQ